MTSTDEQARCTGDEAHNFHCIEIADGQVPDEPVDDLHAYVGGRWTELRRRAQSRFDLDG